MVFTKQFQLAGFFLIGLFIFILIGCAQNNQPHSDDEIIDGASESPIHLERPSKFIAPENVAQLQTTAVWGNGRANATLFSPVGDQFAILTTIGVYLYDSDSWEQTEFIPFPTSIQNASFSPNGRFLAITAYNNQQIQVWDLENKDWATMPEIGESANLQALFMADSDHIVINERAKIGVWSLIDGGWVAAYDAPEKGAFGQMVVSPAENIFAVSVLSDQGEQIVVYSLQTENVPQLLETNATQQVERIRFAEDGQHLVAVLSEGAFAEAYDVNVWSTERWELLNHFVVEGGMNPAKWMISPNGRYLSVLIGHKEVGIWNLLERSDPIILPALERHPLTDMLFSPNNELLFMATSNGQIQQWDVATQTRMGQFDMAEKPLTAISLSADGSLLAFVTDSGVVEVWDDKLALQQIAFSQFGFGEVNDIAYAANGRLMAAATSNGNVNVWQNIEQEPIYAFNQAETNIDSVAFSPDATFLATGSGQRLGPVAFDDSVNIWDIDTQTLGFQLAGEGEDVPGCSFFRNSVYFSADGRFIAAASHDFTVDLWLADNGKHIYKFPPHSDAVLSIAFSPDGQYLATASEDVTTRIWRLADFELVHEFDGRLAGMWSVIFTPDSQSVIVGDSSGLIQQWDLESGQTTHSFYGEKNKFSHLAVSPDGMLLVGGGDELNLNIWSIHDGDLLHQLPGHSGAVLSVAFAPDGQTLISGSRDNTIRVWQLSEE